jgi:hypothetical protein
LTDCDHSKTTETVAQIGKWTYLQGYRVYVRGTLTQKWCLNTSCGKMLEEKTLWDYSSRN